MDTQRSVDFNSLSFNEQATQVLNYLDEIVDSVDNIYKPVSLIDSNRNIYKYEPPENIFAMDNSGIDFKPEDSNDSYYEPYEPLTDITYQPHLKKNPLHAIEEETPLPRDLNVFLKRATHENPYFGQKPGDLYQRKSQNNEVTKKIKASPVKRVFSIRSSNRSESAETTNSSVTAANIGELSIECYLKLD